MSSVRAMKAVEVEARSGSVYILQPSDVDDGGAVEVTHEQAPILAQWILEAAGSAGVAATGRKLEEVKAQAHLFRRLEREAEREQANPDVRVAYRAVRVALEWAAGESDLSPDEWWTEHDGGE